ncbi:uncharacterized protein LOC105201007 [Solenopsis invicta]|uniref:uncharacterized protein LOC105201007 n=1 Tax=Solenopsis invicta TaxID=13686 RepID=UPI0005960605|nr:uncharacterized protein LOC105201007 [Solenopsis invicta]
MFDVGDSEARCIIDNCIINIFAGINSLSEHLNNHGIIECRKALKNEEVQQRNTEQTESQSTAAKDKTSENVNSQLFGAHSQDTENNKELPWGNVSNLVWRYFTPNKKPYAKCNICGVIRVGNKLSHLELHLINHHSKIVDKIQSKIKKEVRYLKLSSYFEFYEELLRARCNINNCHYGINLFYGTQSLRHHLYKYHKSIYTKISQQIQRCNDTDVMTQAKEGNVDTNINNP